MAIVTKFTGWDRPLCEAVAEYILGGVPPGLPDLRGTVVVVPTRQAGFRLQTALARAGGAVLGLEIKTASSMMVPRNVAGVANAAQSLAAWQGVLSATEPGEFEAFLGTRLTGTFALQIARRLEKLRHELADGGYTIAAVADKGGELAEPERWAQMAELEKRYLRKLASCGLRDPSVAKIENAQSPDLPADVRKIILAANPDPPKLLLTLLENWSERGGEVEVLVGAPEGDGLTFNPWGCPDPATWEAREIAIPEESIVLCANPEAEAEWIGKTGNLACRETDGTIGFPACRSDFRQAGKPIVPSLAIGVPDREVVAPLSMRLENAGMPAFDPQSRPFSETPLCHLAQLLLELGGGADAGYETVAALLRHPHVLRYFGDGAKLLKELDEMQSEHLPVTLEDCVAADVSSAGRTTRPPLHIIVQWRDVLRRGPPHVALREIMSEIFGATELHPDSAADQDFASAADVLNGIFAEFEGDVAVGAIGGDVVEILKARLSDASVDPVRRSELVDLEGWLELAWNPEPLLFVAGMNEGLVPDGTIDDVFLPDSLRRVLGLRDDRARLARDAYVLEAILARRYWEHRPPACAKTGAHRRDAYAPSTHRRDAYVPSTHRRDAYAPSTHRPEAYAPSTHRPEAYAPSGGVFILLAKTSAAGDPLKPSRLLFKCADDKVFLARAKRLFGEAPASAVSAPPQVPFKLDPARPGMERHVRTKRYTELSPSSVNNYLDSPLLFYFKEVLCMEKADDLRREPDPPQFGNIVHHALKMMAKDEGEIWACGDAGALADFLAARVGEYCRATFGASPWFGVTVAKESAIARLRVFAEKQVAWHAAGWDIVKEECEAVKRVALPNGMFVGGRIDRVDLNRNNGRRCVLDYKTGAPVKPEKSHMDKNGWKNLQLPIYRLFLENDGIDGDNIGLGYVVIPNFAGNTGFLEWGGYTRETHESAMARLAEVADAIRAGKFAEPGRMKFGDDFAGLLLDEPEKHVELRNMEIADWGCAK